MNQLDTRISELSEKYLPLAVEMLKEVIRIPADYVDKPLEQGGDPECGLSNHEGPRLEYLRNKIIEIGGVRSADDIGFDEYMQIVEAERKIATKMIKQKLDKIDPKVLRYFDINDVNIQTDAKKLAIDPIKSVKENKTTFVPKNWENF